MPVQTIQVKGGKGRVNRIKRKKGESGPQGCDAHGQDRKGVLMMRAETTRYQTGIPGFVYEFPSMYGLVSVYGFSSADRECAYWFGSLYGIAALGH